MQPSLDFNVESSLVFLNPYAILMGLTVVACFSMHGAIYLLMKTEGELHDKVRGWINPAIISFIICYATVTMATLIYQPHMVDVLRKHPEMFLLALLTMLSIANIPREVNQKCDGRAFASSCFAIGSLVALYAIGTYPNLVRASNAPDELSITVHNASSSLGTLQILFTIAAIGIPLVIAYTIGVYYIFHGKVKLDSSSY
jgi:cytochrome d ubiquinol oxidase subunit II